MSRLALSLVAVLSVSLVACTDTGPAAPAGDEPPVADTPAAQAPIAGEPGAVDQPGGDVVGPCDADAASGAIGQIATAAVIEQARMDAGAQTARTIAPDQVVTMEYLETRLNLKVDAGNVVTAVTCG
jgi:hypothetical protein